MANTEEELVYGSRDLLDRLASIVRNHRAVGDDFPSARSGLVANLEALQAALPAAIREVQEADRAHV